MNLKTFKTEECLIKDKHDSKRCHGFHKNAHDWRRELGTYSSERCSFVDKQIECPFGEQCDKSHNYFEEWYHPEKYRTQFCAVYLKNGECSLKEFCSYAHTKSELKIDVLEDFEKD